MIPEETLTKYESMEITSCAAIDWYSTVEEVPSSRLLGQTHESIGKDNNFEPEDRGRH